MTLRTSRQVGIGVALTGVLFGAGALVACSSELPDSGAAPNTGGTTGLGGSSGAGGAGGSTTGGGAAGGAATGGITTGGSAAGGSATGGTETGGNAGSGMGGGAPGGSGGSAGGAPGTSICGTAAENASATLTCPPGSVITSIDFASYGTPMGMCGAFTATSTCDAAPSRSVVESACLGKSTCTVDARNANFGGDPCSMVVKNLSIQATCTSGTGGTGGSGGMGGAGGAAGFGGTAGTGAAGTGGTGGGSTGTWNEGTELKAFPTAEGYGRTAKGGRGGRVIEVTNLNDSGPGSLRDAVLATGARTVVFRVSGVINLQSKLIIRGENRFLTVAGQTAPGKGVVVHGYSFGMIGGEETILRFIRTRVGTTSGVTMDGMGISSSPGPVIYDHLSISWTIDEGFSSRGTVPSNFTLQRSMISECLNDADHEIQMNPHGYAASISGDIGSFHHNLLAHCAGRNWSLAGGLGKDPVAFWGRLDIRNNVVYNWDNRTTDGGAHQVNFVNNYYKPGPASTLFVALSADIENFPGTQSYYFAGNVMPGRFDESNQTAGRRVRYINRTEASVTWPVFVNSEFFPSHVATQSATAAYTDVLGNVGANKPRLDDHDTRILRETRDGTFTYRGSRTNKPGLPDNEADVGGLESYPMETRPATWDTDHDGMPDTWETAHGLNPSNAGDGNATNLSRLGYTNLEMYLNELAGDFR